MQPAPDVNGTLAAIDLGSNSFHLLIARVVDGELRPVDRLREWVQLSAGLDGRGRLTGKAQRRALDCLGRFGERLRDHPPSAVRAVGTNTLRKALNSKAFLRRARASLGHPIKIIPGSEEARLIYLGVAYSLFDDEHRRLVVDIGGGSTECILGRGFTPNNASSLFMGSTSWTREFFPEGRVSSRRMKRAVVAGRLEMQNIESEFLAAGWERSIGASGTILALAEVLREMGWTDRGISREGLERLRDHLIAAGGVEGAGLPAVRAERARVLPGGLAILLAVFESLGIEEMLVSDGALREGLLWDLLGRIGDHDVRDATIERFVERYRVDTAQAARVESTALALLDQVIGRFKLDPDYARRNLRWASKLHEIGLAVAHSGYHKHGAYLVTHSDMAGFSLGGKQTLAALIRGHRRKISLELFAGLHPARARRALRLCLLLRLAVLLNRSRSDRPLPPMKLRARGRRLALTFPEPWLAEQPLVAADLEREARYLAAVNFELEVR